MDWEELLKLGTRKQEEVYAEIEALVEMEPELRPAANRCKALHDQLYTCVVEGVGDDMGRILRSL